MTSTTDRIPVCMTIGSSDSSGGAGIQGDVKSFSSVGCYAAAVVVGITAQNTNAVRDRWTVPVEAVVAQLRAVLDDLPVTAVKLGTTWSAELLAALSGHLAELAGRGVPVVADPVMVAASGSWLSSDAGTRRSFVEHVLPSATVVTPNRQEAELLADRAGASRRELAERIVGLGARAVVVTAAADDAGDWFFDGTRHKLVDVPRHTSGAEHGVGCAHSTIVAGLLAQDWPLPEAIRAASARAAAGVRHGLTHVGRAVHPVDVLDLRDRRCPYVGTRIAWEATP